MKKSQLRKIIKEVISEQIDPGKAVPLKGPKPGGSQNSSVPMWTCDFMIGANPPDCWCTLVPAGQTGQYYSQEECVASGCNCEGGTGPVDSNWGCAAANGECVPSINGPFQSEQECIEAGCGGNITLGYTCPDVMPIFNASDYCVNASSPNYSQFVLSCCSESDSQNSNIPQGHTCPEPYYTFSASDTELIPNQVTSVLDYCINSTSISYNQFVNTCCTPSTSGGSNRKKPNIPITKKWINR